MDFGSLTINLEATPMFLDHPLTGAPMDGPEDAVFYLLHPQSDKVLDVDRKFRNKILKSKQGINSADEFDNQMLEILVACVDSWENVKLEGVDLPCTPANVRKLLSNPELVWVKDQIKNFVDTTSNFLKQA